MSKSLLQGIALIVLLLPLPLISIGTMQNAPVMWWTGIALLVLGGLVPPVTRYTGDGD